LDRSEAGLSQLATAGEVFSSPSGINSSFLRIRLDRKRTRAAIIAKLDRLKKEGSISDVEFARLRADLVAVMQLFGTVEQQNEEGANRHGQ